MGAELPEPGGDGAGTPPTPETDRTEEVAPEWETAMKEPGASGPSAPEAAPAEAGEEEPPAPAATEPLEPDSRPHGGKIPAPPLHDPLAGRTPAAPRTGPQGGKAPSDPRPGPIAGKATTALPIDLLDHLLSLTGALPEGKREVFQKSDYRLRIEALKNQLKGGKGLHAEEPPPRQETRPPGSGSVLESMNFFALLAANHPEPGIGALLSEKISRVAKKISRGKGT